MPTAAVRAGDAGLLVLLALPAALVALLSKLLTLELNVEWIPARSELRLLAALPVAVARTLEMLLAREPASPVRLLTWDATAEVMEAMFEDASERREETLAPSVASEMTEPAPEVATAPADVISLPMEESTEEAVWRRPPGLSVAARSVVGAKSWA